ncbi:putative F-box domain-containing protein [Helianthus annuus]|nr:putative F-box domain-containing protein [Helianthus annuus]
MAADDRSLIELPKVNLEAVLTKLPLRSLLVCCCVSKSLLNLIKNDSDFAQVHLAKSEPRLMIQCLLDPSLHLIDVGTDTASRVEVKSNFNIPLNGFEITHSCNGLLLMEHIYQRADLHRCMLFNPVIGEYTLLPETIIRYRTVMSGFFYCPKTHRFEVLCMFYRLKPYSDVSSHIGLDPDSDSDPAVELNHVSDHDTISEDSDDPEHYSDIVYSEGEAIGEIYVKGSDSWESLGNLPFSPLTIYDPCHLEKAVHWICADVTIPNLIVSFNFETHEFGEIPGPAHVGKTHANPFYDLNLVVLGNRLSVFDRFTTRRMFNIWVMKEYGVKDSWSREFVFDTTACGVDLYRFCTPVTCRNDGELVVVSVHGLIVFYDLLKKTGRIVDHPPLIFPTRVVTHTPSLMSLRDVVRGTNLEVVKVAPRYGNLAS